MNRSIAEYAVAVYGYLIPMASTWTGKEFAARIERSSSHERTKVCANIIRQFCGTITRDRHGLKYNLINI